MSEWRDKEFEDLAYWLGAEFEIRACGTTYADAMTYCMWVCWREAKRRYGHRWWEFWK